MKIIKKFNEYKSLNKSDLGLWLRKGDLIKIICHDGVHKNGEYEVVSFNEDDIEVAYPTDITKTFWLSLEDLNDRWELVSINNEPFMVTESDEKKLRPLTKEEEKLLKTLSPKMREKYLKQRK